MPVDPRLTAIGVTAEMVDHVTTQEALFMGGGKVANEMGLQYALAWIAIQKVRDGAISAKDLAQVIAPNESIDMEIKVMMAKTIIGQGLCDVNDIQHFITPAMMKMVLF